MGWLFAVALGLQEHRRGKVLLMGKSALSQLIVRSTTTRAVERIA
jgi:hypothetical protein